MVKRWQVAWATILRRVRNENQENFQVVNRRERQLLHRYWILHFQSTWPYFGRHLVQVLMLEKISFIEGTIFGRHQRKWCTYAPYNNHSIKKWTHFNFHMGSEAKFSALLLKDKPTPHVAHRDTNTQVNNWNNVKNTVSPQKVSTTANLPLLTLKITEIFNLLWNDTFLRSLKEFFLLL